MEKAKFGEGSSTNPTVSGFTLFGRFSTGEGKCTLILAECLTEAITGSGIKNGNVGVF